MDAAGAAPSPAAVVGERVAVKLRGYFDLAKEEIDKAVRAEEWGLPDEATAHYRNAMRVMLEAKAARVPDAVSSRCARVHFLVSIADWGFWNVWCLTSDGALWSLQREGAGQGVPREDRQVAGAGRGAAQSAWSEKW